MKNVIRLGDGSCICDQCMPKHYPSMTEPVTGWIADNCDYCEEWRVDDERLGNDPGPHSLYNIRNTAEQLHADNPAGEKIDINVRGDEIIDQHGHIMARRIVSD